MAGENVDFRGLLDRLPNNITISKENGRWYLQNAFYRVSNDHLHQAAADFIYLMEGIGDHDKRQS